MSPCFTVTIAGDNPRLKSNGVVAEVIMTCVTAVFTAVVAEVVAAVVAEVTMTCVGGATWTTWK